MRRRHVKTDRYLLDGKTHCDLLKLPTSPREDNPGKEKLKELIEKNLEESRALQSALMADAREGIVFVIQAVDTAGKDSLIRHVFSGLDPSGLMVHSFRKPTAEELRHDYLWRIERCLPERGKIAVFNRSHYEDVLSVAVKDFREDFRMADRVMKLSDKSFLSRRLRQIADYEEYLYENSYRMVKICLNLSKEEQKKRLLYRMEQPEKQHKFHREELDERALFEETRKAFTAIVNRTATKHSPWYVLPADDKWYARFLMSEVILRTLRSAKPKYPKLRKAEREAMEECREQLMTEKMG